MTWLLWLFQQTALWCGHFVDDAAISIDLSSGSWLLSPANNIRVWLMYAHGPGPGFTSLCIVSHTVTSWLDFSKWVQALTLTIVCPLAADVTVHCSHLLSVRFPSVCNCEKLLKPDLRTRSNISANDWWDSGVERVVHLQEGLRFNLIFPPLCCRSVLEQVTGHQLAPDGCAGSVWVMGDTIWMDCMNVCECVDVKNCSVKSFEWSSRLEISI